MNPNIYKPGRRPVKATALCVKPNLALCGLSCDCVCAPELLSPGVSHRVSNRLPPPTLLCGTTKFLNLCGSNQRKNQKKFVLGVLSYFETACRPSREPT